MTAEKMFSKSRKYYQSRWHPSRMIRLSTCVQTIFVLKKTNPRQPQWSTCTLTERSLAYSTACHCAQNMCIFHPVECHIHYISGNVCAIVDPDLHEAKSGQIFHSHNQSSDSDHRRLRCRPWPEGAFVVPVCEILNVITRTKRTNEGKPKLTNQRSNW